MGNRRRGSDYGGTITAQAPVLIPSALSDGLLVQIIADTGVTKDGSNLVSNMANFGTGADYTAAGGARPLWEATGLNGKQCISTDGIATWLGCSGGTLATHLTGSDKPFTLAWFGSIPSPTNNRCLCAFDGLTAPNQGRHLFPFSITTLQVQRVDDAGSPVGQTMDTDTSGTNRYIVSFAGTTVTIWKNGTKIVNAAALNVGSATFDFDTIGGQRPLGLGIQSFQAHKFHERLIWDTAANDSRAALIDTYLVQKWG